MKKRGVIVIDLQNEYLPSGKLPLSGIESAAANAAKVIDNARTNGIPVFHIQHEFANGEMPVFVPGSDGVKIQPAVAPVEGEPLDPVALAERLERGDQANQPVERERFLRTQ